jgi:hypothetical protein
MKWLMRTDIEEKVLEKLATSDKATIVIERQPDGKMRVTSGSWDGEKVILRDQAPRWAKSKGACTSRESRCTTTRGIRRLSRMAPWDQFTDDCAWSITPVPRYTSLLTVIDHAGPVSDHANPVIDH